MNIDQFIAQLKFPTHTRPKKSAVSVYIGPDTIEIVEVKRTPQGIAVLNTISKQIPQERMSEDELKTEIASLIKEAFTICSIKDNLVTTTIPEESVMLRRFKMPMIPKRDRRTAVLFEAKRHIPFTISEVTSDFFVLKENKSIKQMEVLFFAVKRDEINYIADVINQAGLKIEKIEPMSLALIKNLSANTITPTTSPLTTIMHFCSNTKANIIITENGIPYLKREVSILQKDDILREQVLNEFRLSANYYKREFPEKNISRFILSGLTEAPKWLPSLQTSLNIPVEHITPLQELTNKDLPSSQFEIPLGLALRMLEKQTLNLNLLPLELTPIKYNIPKVIAIEVVTAIIITTIISLIQIPQLMHTEKELSFAKKNKLEYSELELDKKTMDELKATDTEWLKKGNILNKFTQSQISWYDKLKEFAEIIPEDSWTTQLSLNNSPESTGAKKLIIKGKTYTENPVKELEATGSFFKKLKSDTSFMAGFRDASLGTINKTTIDKHEVVEFEITIVN